MWIIAFRAGVASTTKGRRLYSSRGSSKITAYLRDLSYFTRDPVWRLVMALHSPQRVSLSEALDASHISLDDFSRWRPSLYASDIKKAVENTSLRAHPSWLVLYLAGFKVRTAQHASGALMDLSFAHLEVAPPAIQRPLLVIAMMHLARFNLMWPMQRVIDAFLLVPLAQFQDVHFNHLLAAMTSISQRSPQTGENAVTVLRAMEARQLRLWPNTCSALLEDRYATLQLTSYLRRRMTSLGTVPTASQLESYLRVYSANGAIHDAKQYAATIRHLRQSRDVQENGEDHGSAEEQASAHFNRMNRANGLLLRSQPDSASAFQFLLRLAERTISDRPFQPRLRPPIYPRTMLGKRGVDMYDWSTALSVAARDLSVDTRTLIRLYERTRPQIIEFRTTAASHTILIRGLLRRREWEVAYIHWTKLSRTGLPIDNAALVVGLQAATLSGRPAEAFTLLEVYAARTDTPLSSPYRVFRPLVVTAAIINVFMASLKRILRPDLVFRLWDAMEELYSVRPSLETLRIMLEAAQLPHTLDDSFSGQLALLALKNPFRHPPAPLQTRAALVDSLTAQAAAPYRSGIWRERPATETASHIFIQIALGAPERLHIAALMPPAYAVRAHPESDSAALTMRLDMAPARFALPPDILTPAGRPHFPELVLHERDFGTYIMLLGMTRRAPEIARTLVWMRALGLQPTQQTLGVALAFWGEVSVQPPVIAAMAGRDGDQYRKLVGWLRLWCGEVPDEKTVGRWRARITRVKMQRREMVGGVMDEEDMWVMEPLRNKNS
ncbi:hypothetical protein C8R44DRAFT_8287 [Mycena epipterygia]|nr:hypothetical protein C8R44DRAFT_8287 [Mycena epipterygia]